MDEQQSDATGTARGGPMDGPIYRVDGDERLIKSETRWYPGRLEPWVIGRIYGGSLYVQYVLGMYLWNSRGIAGAYSGVRCFQV